MKSIIVPKTAIPPAVETLVLQITPKEAAELLEISQQFYLITGARNYCSGAFEKHLKQFLEFIKSKELK